MRPFHSDGGRVEGALAPTCSRDGERYIYINGLNDCEFMNDALKKCN